MIALVQVASDDLKKAYIGYSAVLHTHETLNEFTKASLAEAEAKIRQIKLDYGIMGEQ